MCAATEHQRVVDMLKSGDVLFDVYAGVGPFAIPAAKKGVTVHANDLNPHSHSALVTNVKLNKVKAGTVHTYNMDGRDFIQTVVKQELATVLQARAKEQSKTPSSSESQQGTPQSPGEPSPGESHRLYITMNLPALALHFLDAFCGLLSDFPEELRCDPRVADSLPTVLCYCFSKSDDVQADVRERVEEVMGHQLPSGSVVRHVRNVAPHKEMMCVVFPLTPQVLCGGARGGRGRGDCSEHSAGTLESPLVCVRVLSSVCASD